MATDAAAAGAARRLAGRVFLRLARVGPARARGTRRLVPRRGRDGDLDLDRTLDPWDPGRSGRPGPEDLVTRNWTAHRRAVCLLVDTSGSMQGLARGAGRGGRGRCGAGRRASDAAGAGCARRSAPA